MESEVSGTRFVSGSVPECNIAHHRSVVVLCILPIIRCNSMHNLYGTPHIQFVPVRMHAVQWSLICMQYI